MKLGCFILVKVDMVTIQKLQLELNIHQIKDALLDHKNMGGVRLKETDVEVVTVDKIRVFPPLRQQGNNRLLYFQLQALKKLLPNAVVCGIRSTSRAVINKDDKKSPTRYNLLVEGYGLLNVMATPGIKSSSTSSNHVMEVEKTLGIEAARKTIMKEISSIMASYGIAVDARHIQMLGDCMTYRGVVLGINRHGIMRMRSSALMLASFEKTADHIFDAAARRRLDPVTGVSECIILGSTVNLGTGLFKLLYDFNKQGASHESVDSAVQMARKPLLSNWRQESRRYVDATTERKDAPTS